MARPVQFSTARMTGMQATGETRERCCRPWPGAADQGNDSASPGNAPGMDQAGQPDMFQLMGMVTMVMGGMMMVMGQFLQQLAGGQQPGSPEAVSETPGGDTVSGSPHNVTVSDPGSASSNDGSATGNTTGQPDNTTAGSPGGGQVIQRLSGSDNEKVRQGIQAILAEEDDPEMAKLAIAQFLLESGLDVGAESHTVDDNNLFNIKAEGTAGWANSTGDYNGAGQWEPNDRFGANLTANDSVRQWQNLWNWSNYQGIHSAGSFEEKLQAIQSAPLPYAEDPRYVEKVTARYYNLMRNNPDIASMFQQRYGVAAA